MLEAGTALDFFAGEETRALKSEQAIDALRAKFGADAVVSGRALKTRRQPL
jgi:DNA polymerase-4